jgi:hypothetical protein
VSKFFTIGVSFVNEMPEPIPIGVIVCLSSLALTMSFAIPTKDFLDKMTSDLKSAQKKLRDQHIADMEKVSSGVALQGATPLGKDGKPQINKEEIY